MARAFDGVRVLDFTQVVSGPFATQWLAFQGATVIKFERAPGGDESRTFCTSPELLARRIGSGYLGLNAAKRSVALNLKSPEAVALVRRMVAEADVVVENFRPGVMARLGLGYEALREIRPDLVYCAISGYGQSGPAADAPAYDGAVQAASGIMSITGEPGRGPMRVGFPMSDAATGVSAAFAIASALYRRQATGEGQFIDVAMNDATIALMTQVVAYWTIAGTEPTQYGNRAWSGRPTSDLFKAGDGALMMVVNTEAQFDRLLTTIGREDLKADPRFADWPSRLANVDALRAAIEAAFATRSPSEWEAILRAAGVTASQVKSIPEALASEQLRHRRLLVTVPAPAGYDRPMTVINAPFVCDVDGPDVDGPPPECGEHTDEELRRIGCDDGDLARLRADGVIWSLDRRTADR